MFSRTIGFLPVLALLVIGLVYFNVTELAYVWDDNALFVDSSLLRNPENIWNSISISILPGSTYFRPLVMLSFIAEFKVFGLQPSVSHAINLIIFLFNCSLVGLLAARLMSGLPKVERLLRITLAMLLYGLHPAILESTAWVVGRFDLLVTAFFLLALWVYSRFSGPAALFVMGLCLLLSLFSKEMAVTFPVVLVLWHWCSTSIEPGLGVRWRSLWSPRLRNALLVVLSVIILYLLIRHSVRPDMVASDKLYASADWLVRTMLVGQTLLFYVHMAFWPFADINPMHPLNPFDLNSRQIIAGWTVVLALPLLGWWGAVRGRRQVLLLLCTLVAFMPVLNIIPLVIAGNVGHERFMTLPLVFLSIAVANLSLRGAPVSEAMSRFAPVLGGFIAMVWLVLSALTTHSTLPLWTNENSLWRWAYSKHPDFNYVQFNFVSSLVSQGRLDEAEQTMDEIEKRDGKLGSRLKGMKGELLVRRGKPEEALKLLDESLVNEYQPHLEAVQKKVPLSMAHIVRDAVPDSWYVRFVYGARAEAHLNMHQFQAAMDDLDIMGFYDSNYGTNYLFRSYALYGLNQVKQGDEYFERALKEFEPSAIPMAHQLREVFFRSLCQTPDHSYEVCNRLSKN